MTDQQAISIMATILLAACWNQGDEYDHDTNTTTAVERADEIWRQVRSSLCDSDGKRSLA